MEKAVTVIVKYNRAAEEFTAVTLGELQAAIERRFGVAERHQKLIVAGRRLFAATPETTKLSDLEVSDLSKLLLVGSTEEAASAAASSLETITEKRLLKRERDVVDDFDLSSAQSGPGGGGGGGGEGGAWQNHEYGFASLRVLSTHPDLGMPLPEAEQAKAQAILEELASDPGVLAAMAKHRFKVGQLAEMWPAGQVGVSEVCVLGLNENHGQRILLRLRTDDLKGFRKPLSIKKVLFHELAHNVYSEHDGKFNALMRAIERDAEEMDYRRQGAVLGGAWRPPPGQGSGRQATFEGRTATLGETEGGGDGNPGMLGEGGCVDAEARAGVGGGRLEVPGSFATTVCACGVVHTGGPGGACSLVDGSRGWNLVVSFKGRKVMVPATRGPDESIEVVLQYAAGEFNFHVDGANSDLVKLLHKGRRLKGGTLAEHGVKDGAKLMLIASSQAAVEQTNSRQSDPTIRGFEEEARVLDQRRKGLQGDTVWEGEQDRQYHFSKFQVWNFERDASPHPFEAEKLLRKLATDPGVVETMRRHKWTVGTLCEMDPADDRLKGTGGGCTLGYNENRGFRIYLRLRLDDLKGFRPYRELINTLLHELSHNEHGPHLDAFWSLFATLKINYLSTHHELQRKGTLIRGTSTAALADLNGDAMDIDGALETELAGDAANAALEPAERAAAQRVYAAHANAQRMGLGANAAAAASEEALSNAKPAARDKRSLALEAAERRAAAGTEALPKGDARDEPPRPAPLPSPPAAPASVVETPPAAAAAATAVSSLPSRDPGAAEDAVHTSAAAAAAQPMDVDNNDGTRAGKEEAEGSAAASGVASSSEPGTDASVELILAMGLGHNASAVARSLELAGGDMERAIAWLLEHDEGATRAVAQEQEQLSPNASREERIAHYGKAISRIDDGALECHDTLIAMLRQIQLDPQEPKWRRVKLSNKRVRRTIGRHPPAIAFLEAIGFEVEGGFFHLKRDDPGLLWLGCSTLEESRRCR